MTKEQAERLEGLIRSNLPRFEGIFLKAGILLPENLSDDDKVRLMIANFADAEKLGDAWLSPLLDIILNEPNPLERLSDLGL